MMAQKFDKKKRRRRRRRRRVTADFTTCQFADFTACQFGTLEMHFTPAVRVELPLPLLESGTNTLITALYMHFSRDTDMQHAIHSMGWPFLHLHMQHNTACYVCEGLQLKYKSNILTDARSAETKFIFTS